MLFLLIFFFVDFRNHYVSVAVDVPVWPCAYSVKGTLRIPAAEIIEPFDAWYDNGLGSSRVDYYKGSVKTYQISRDGKYGTQYKLEPVLTSIQCYKREGTLASKIVPQSVLPNMTGYKFTGQAIINGVKAEKWELASMTDMFFTMYLYWKTEGSSKVIVPLRYDQMGSDHHFIDFEQFSAVPPSSSIFKIKDVSSCKPLIESDFDGIEDQPIYSFNPIKEYIENVTDHLDLAWQNYKQQFSKNYSSEEDILRKKIFSSKIRYVTSTNRANLSYSVGLNHMSDYTPEEIKDLTSCVFENGYFGNGEVFEEPENNTVNEVDLPANWDWRRRGAVTPVKDQGQCGSCWSFSTTGAIEGAYFIRTRKLVTLSEQALIDCSWNFGNRGCDGGYMDGSFKWVLRNRGIPLARTYGPYRGQQNYCRIKRGAASVRIRSYRHLHPNCPSCIKRALVKYGPITVGMHANNAFLHYKRGVFNDHGCPKNMNHAMLIVGYGKLQGREYWLIKNSWSNWWGENGYALMGIQGNICGVMADPMYVQA